MIKNETIKCTCCGNLMKNSSFYKSYSFIFKNNSDSRMSVCKECLLEIYAIYLEKYRDRKKAIFEVCKKVDAFFSDSLYEAVEIQAQKANSNVCKIYFQKANSLKQYRGLTFDNAEMLEIVTVEQRIKNANENTGDGELDSKLFSEKWMGTYTKRDLEYLDNYLNRLQEDFKIVTINHIDYAKKIAKASLAMDQAYSDLISGVSGAEGRYKNLKDAFDSLSKSAQFSESNRGDAVGVSGLSQIIDSVEGRSWIPSTEEFKKDDLDHLMNQFANISKSL